MRPDGTGLLDEGRVIVDGDRIPGWFTLEGPKLYRHDGWFWIFAPAGGVETGWQGAFRSRDFFGPYEERIVLEQGDTDVNGPHQGGWVRTPSGEDWFLHFQQRGAYGRVVHLQPMRWGAEGWPVIGDGGARAPASRTPQRPDCRPSPPAAPPPTTTSRRGALGPQWQWTANPAPAWASLAAPARLAPPRLRARPGRAQRWLTDGEQFLRRAELAAAEILRPAFTATTVLRFAPAADGETAGLAVFGYNYALLGLRRAGDQTRLVLLVNVGADKPGARHREVASAGVHPGPVSVRVTVDENAFCHLP